MAARSASPESVIIRHGASKSITVAPGTMVLVRYRERQSYGAVIARITGCHAHLTFTPRDKPRKVPLGMVLAAVGAGDAMLDLSSVPRYQPHPTVAPRRSRRVKADV